MRLSTVEGAGEQGLRLPSSRVDVGRVHGLGGPKEFVVSSEF